MEITEDLIDELSRLSACRDVLNRTAPLFSDDASFAAAGSHEYYRGFQAITDMLAQTPVRVFEMNRFIGQEGRERGPSIWQ